MLADYTTRLVNYAPEIDGYYPLRPIQRWMINTHLNKKNSTMMNLGLFYKLPPEIDLERIEKVLNEITNSFDIFRCRLVYREGTNELCQRFDGEILPIRIEKISDEELEERKKFLKKPYKLINNPLYRMEIFQTPSGNFVYTDFYHAMFDGTTLAVIFWHEVDLRYKGRKILHAPLKYSDYILEELKISPEEFEKGNRYWREMLKGFDEKKHLPPADIEGREDWKSNQVYHDIENIDREFFTNSSWNEDIFFLAASMLAIAKSTGEKKSIMSRVHQGRTNVQEMRIMGIMIEQIPISWDFEKDLTAEEFLNGLEKKVAESMKYRKSLATVYSEGLEDNCATFIFQKKIMRDLFIVGNLPIEILDMPDNKYSAAENTLDIEVNLTDDGKYFICLDYDASRYSENAMKNFAEIIVEVVSKLKDEKIFISEILK